MRFEEIKELIELCSEKKIAELDVEMKGVKVHILSSHQPPSVEYVSAPHSAAPVTYSAMPAPTMPAPHAEMALPAPGGPAAAEKPAGGKEVRSPMVGTFYRAPSPDAPPFVETGQNVGPETVVCIIEAMKLMNEIKAEISGKIVKALVENGQPVEYNQPLFLLES